MWAKLLFRAVFLRRETHTTSSSPPRGANYFSLIFQRRAEQWRWLCNEGEISPRHFHRGKNYAPVLIRNNLTRSFAPFLASPSFFPSFSSLFHFSASFCPECRECPENARRVDFYIHTRYRRTQEYVETTRKWIFRGAAGKSNGRSLSIPSVLFPRR